MDKSKPLIAVIGPTASGKTRRAVEIARVLGGEIISGDSRQVYRGMDLGTGKDLDEYGEVPYHLIDIEDAGKKYNLFEFLLDAEAALAGIRERGNVAIICGGSGLYVESFLKGMRLPPVPENPALRERLSGKSLEELADILGSMKALHNVTDLDTVQRAIRAIEIQTYYCEHPDASELVKPASPREALIIGIEIGREERRARISRRLEARLESGMTGEVKRLLESGVSPDALMYYGLEYNYVTRYVTGQITLGEMKTQLEIAIHQFAKRQMTWFRGMERRGFKINWLPFDMPADEFVEQVKALYNQTEA